jgi:hypothetical protein
MSAPTPKETDWESRFICTGFIAFLAIVAGVALAVIIWALATAISYASCEMNPQTQRCQLVAERDIQRDAEYFR